MDPPPPVSLPDAPDPGAPWCTALDNLELGILLLSQPWVAGAGVRRADLERQLARLDLPFGPVYFQRVKRAVARLEEIGILRGSGEGRARSFTATPEGFAALLLNLGALRADPTLDGTEFELKRSLVAMLNLLFERLADLPEETPAPPEIERFFDEAGRIAVGGRRVITEEVERQALDVLRLIAEQRCQVESRLRSAREGLARAGRGQEGEVDLARLAENGFGEVSSLLAETPEALAALRRLARGAFPRLRHAAAALRYERYLEYLDGLASLYAAELKTVGLAAYLAARRGG